MARKNYIFVDCENVQAGDLDRIANKPVRVILVLGEAHKKLPVPLVKQLMRYSAQVELVEVGRSGRNAADFVLAQHVGEVMKADPQGFIHILSKDKGFDSLVAHNRTNGSLVARHASLAEIPVVMNVAERATRMVSYYTQKNTTRPKKRNALAAQVQAVFGKTLTPDEVEATINELIASKFVAASEKGEIHFLYDPKPAPSATSPANQVAIKPPVPPAKQNASPVLTELVTLALNHLRSHPGNRPKLKASLANYLFSQLGQKHSQDKIYAAIKLLRQGGQLSFVKNSVTYHL